MAETTRPLRRAWGPALARRAPLLSLVGVALLFVAVPPLLPGWVLFQVTVALAKAMVVVGVVLLLMGGLVSFGQGMFYAAGAYAAAFTMRHLGVNEAVVLTLVGTLAGAVLGVIFGLPLSRYRGIFFAMLNLGFSMIIYALLLKFYWVTGGTDGLRLGTPTVLGIKPSVSVLRVVQYYFTLVFCGLGLYFTYRFSQSPLGYAMRALKDNEVRVEYMGASVRRTIFWAYVVAAALGGLGGVLTALAVQHIVPEYSYWLASGEFVFVALLGGTGSVLAPVPGSLLFEFVRNYAYKYSPYTWQMTLGFVLLFVMLFLPGGLWSLAQVVRARWEQWRWSWRRET